MSMRVPSRMSSSGTTEETRLATACASPLPTPARCQAITQESLHALGKSGAGKGGSSGKAGFESFLQERARRIVQEAGELQRSAELYQTGQGGPLRLGLGATPSAVLMAPLLVHLVREHPRLKVWLSSGSIPMQLQALRMRNLDGLVVDWLALPQDQDLQIERLPAMRSGFLCRPGHPLRGRRRIGLAELSRYPIATTPLNQETIRQMVQSLGDKAHPEHFITIQCEDIPSLLEAICATDALFMGVLAGAPSAGGVLR